MLHYNVPRQQYIVSQYCKATIRNTTSPHGKESEKVNDDRKICYIYYYYYYYIVPPTLHVLSLSYIVAAHCMFFPEPLLIQPFVW